MLNTKAAAGFELIFYSQILVLEFSYWNYFFFCIQSSTHGHLAFIMFCYCSLKVCQLEHAMNCNVVHFNSAIKLCP